MACSYSERPSEAASSSTPSSSSSSSEEEEEDELEASAEEGSLSGDGPATTGEGGM